MTWGDEVAKVLKGFNWVDDIVESARGETTNNIDITKAIYTKTMNTLSQKGNTLSIVQSNTTEGNNIYLDGSDCDSNHATTMSIGNYNEVELSAMVDAVAQAFADIIIDLKDDIKSDVKSDLMKDIHNNISNKTEIVNELVQQIEQNCNNIDTYQEIKFLNNNVHIKCGSFDITNKNVQKLDCVINALSDVKHDIETTIQTKVIAETGSDNTLLIIVITIVVVIIIIIFIVIFVVVIKNKSKIVKKVAKTHISK